MVTLIENQRVVGVMSNDVKKFADSLKTLERKRNTQKMPRVVT
jgi:hypothetical protein